VAEWSDFFVAQAGASAALAGLLFVGLSINLERIVGYPHLLYRAGSALVLLLAILLVSSLLLAPGTSDRVAALETLGVGLVAWLAASWLTFSGVSQAPPEHKRTARAAIVLAQPATLPMVMAGLVMLWNGTDGLYWLLPAFIAGFLVAVTDGWVLLVEIHR